MTTQGSTSPLINSTPDNNSPNTSSTPDDLLDAFGLATEVIVAPELDELPSADVAARTGTETFDTFGIAEPICAALRAVGITQAFPIQALTLPIALDGHDVIGQARTGTGKTFAFGLPMLQRIVTAGRGKPSTPRSLVIVPTRELAIQVADDLRTAAAGSDVNVVTLYGGRAYEPQIEALAAVDLVVGTPGRLLDLARQHLLDLSGVDVLVLDEADRMLDLGFLPDVESILKLTPADRQTMLFSATMPGEVVTLAKRHLHRPTHIRAEQHDEPAHVPTTDQHVFRVHHLDKIEIIARVLQAEGRGLTIVFCRTRRACDQVTTILTDRGFAAAAVHGDLGQSQRERALRAFRSGKVDVLVATDVAARGLDVDDVTHVVNYECPEDEKAYLHRIGRTGRAGRTGVAVTFVDWQDMARWKLIDAALTLGEPEPLETYSTSPHLYSTLVIPQGTTGALPTLQRERAGLDAEALEDIGETGKQRSRQRQQRGGRGHGRKPGVGQSTSSDTARHGATRAKARSGQEEEAAGAVKRPRRRTRGGAPVKPAIEPAAHIQHADAATAPEPANAQGAARTGPPRRRRRPSRSPNRGLGPGHVAEGQHAGGIRGVAPPSQHSSTRSASKAERRDIANDLAPRAEGRGAAWTEE